MADDNTPCQLHVHMSSVDRPGILAEALESIVQLNWDVLDIKQFVFNGLLNLYLSAKIMESFCLNMVIASTAPCKLLVSTVS